MKKLKEYFEIHTLYLDKELLLSNSIDCFILNENELFKTGSNPVDGAWIAVNECDVEKSIEILKNKYEKN